MSAVLYVSLSVLVWSFLPLAGAFVLQKINLWDFLLWAQSAAVISSWILLQVVIPNAKAAYPTFKSLTKKAHMECALVGLTYILSLACMWAAFSYVSRAGAAVIYDMWPILSIFLTPLIIRKGWNALPARNFLYGIIALAGAAFILAPELKTPFFLQQGVTMKAILILLLPLFGGLFMAISSVVKSRLSHDLENADHVLVSQLAVQTYCLLYGLVFAKIFASIAGVGGAVHDTYDGATVCLLLLVGIVIYTLGSLFYVIGLLKSPKSNIIVLWYFTPIISIVWLVLAGLATVTPYLIIGTIAIICTNLLITIRAEERISYSATVITLLLVGIVCFFTHGHEMEDYYQAMSVPLIFYAIVVAFLMDRIIRRDTFEEDLAISVIKHIQEETAGKRDDALELIEHVTAMLRTNNVKKIAGHYEYLRNDVSAMQPVQEKLDALALSKVEGVNFSELLVLSLIGLLTIVMTVFFRPPDFIADCFAVVMTTSIAFIFFMVIDLVRSRSVFYLKAGNGGRFTLTSDVLRNAGSEVIIASIMIVAVIVAFVFLMWVKHNSL